MYSNAIKYWALMLYIEEIFIHIHSFGVSTVDTGEYINLMHIVLCGSA